MITNSNIKKNGDYIYYNISVAHDDRIAPNGEPTKLIFSETRDDAILENPSEYVGSVVRFTIPSNTIPLTRIYIQPSPNTNINLTRYSVTLQYTPTNQYYQTYLEYIPQDNTAKIPPAVYENGTPNYVEYGQYYFIYSQQQFLDMINLAFIRSLSKLNSDHPGTQQFAPYMYRTVGEKFGINIPQSYIIPNSSIQKQINLINVFINRELNVYFSNSFNTIKLGYDLPFGNDNQFIIENLFYNSLSTSTSAILGDATFRLSLLYLNTSVGFGYPGSATTDVFSLEQEYDTLPLWYEPLSLSIVCVGIPVRYELSPSSGIGLTNQNSLIGTNIVNQITDFDTHTSIGNEFRTFIQYFPTAEYRYFDLTSNSPLKSFNIQAFWKDNYNNFYQIYLPSYYTASIKILFKKKI